MVMDGAQHAREKKRHDVIDSILVCKRATRAASGRRDGNGEIELDEFIHMMEHSARFLDTDEGMRKAFRIFDKTGNGYAAMSIDCVCVCVLCDAHATDNNTPPCIQRSK